jgi:hypothetical protein
MMFFKAITFLVRLAITALWKRTYRVYLTNGTDFAVKARTTREAAERFGTPIGRVEVLSVQEED